MAQKQLTKASAAPKPRAAVSKETTRKAREAHLKEAGEPATAFGKKVEDLPPPGLMGPPEGTSS